MHVHHEPVREEIAKSNRHSAAFVSGGRHCHNYGEFHIRKRKCAAQQIPVHVTSVGSRVHRSWRTLCSAKRGKAKSEQNERERDGKGEREQKKRNTSIRVGSSLCLIRTHAKCRHNFGFVCHFKFAGGNLFKLGNAVCAFGGPTTPPRFIHEQQHRASRRHSSRGAHSLVLDAYNWVLMIIWNKLNST